MYDAMMIVFFPSMDIKLGRIAANFKISSNNSFTDLKIERRVSLITLRRIAMWGRYIVFRTKKEIDIPQIKISN